MSWKTVLLVALALVVVFLALFGNVKADEMLAKGRRSAIRKVKT